MKIMNNDYKLLVNTKAMTFGVIICGMISVINGYFASIILIATSVIFCIVTHGIINKRYLPKMYNVQKSYILHLAIILLVTIIFVLDNLEYSFMAYATIMFSNMQVAVYWIKQNRRSELYKTIGTMIIINVIVAIFI